jgi:hypothetical protein
VLDFIYRDKYRIGGKVTNNFWNGEKNFKVFLKYFKPMIVVN